MNKEKQRRRILSFLQGKGGKDADAFCVYQWIERCHFEGWWDLALSLAQSVPPNSLNQDYHKRLNYLFSDCRHNLKTTRDTKVGPKRRYIRRIPSECSGKVHPLPDLMFENSSRETLRQIYSVLFYMNSYDGDFPDAVRWSMRVLNVNDYQTVCDKCARRFAGTVYRFKESYDSGDILQKLDMKFGLSPNDYMIFKDLLEGEKSYVIGQKAYTNE
ncbi:MAG TPA: hypothetical protein VMW89_09355 [Desulfatiglandales bacterium]|nr:hypothetical protein [Desulfatiglandales bacterium]